MGRPDDLPSEITGDPRTEEIPGERNAGEGKHGRSVRVDKVNEVVPVPVVAGVGVGHLRPTCGRLCPVVLSHASLGPR